jgi:ABC-type sugar transport system substrate-binding protein
MRYLWALAAIIALMTSCSRHRPLVVMLPGGADETYWRLAHVGAIQAALAADADIAIGAAGDRRVAGYVVGPGTAVPRDLPAVGLRTNGRLPGVRSEVSSDYRTGGADAAVWAVEIVGGEGEVAVISPDAAETEARQRIRGFVERLKTAAPAMRVVAIESAGSEREKARAAMAALVERFPALRVVYADSETVAIGAVEELKARANTRVRTIAFARSATLIHDLETRVIDGLLVEDAVGAGRAAVEAVLRLHRGERVPPVIQLPVRLVHRFDLEKPEIIDLLRPDVEGWHNKLKLRL